jgi:hypothetical protein
MDDSDINKINKKIKGKKTSICILQRYIIDVRTFFQSIWIRCCAIFANITDRHFMQSELRFVLYSGILFWGLYLLYEIFK